ncbi:MAG TPA: HutD family protein [Vineibacter sp.]|nr:HutD family protein [Vineibacter sp.]
MDIVRVDRLPTVPWKNKGGLTRAIAASPAGADFDTADWRVDLTDITQAGPFSHLSGIDRILVPLGAGLRLGFDGADPAPIEIFHATAFDGATPTTCALDAQAAGRGVQAINLLLRRGRATGRLLGFPGSGRLREAGGTVVLYAARGGFTLVADGGRPVPLDVGHAALHADAALPLAFEPYRPWSMLIAAVIQSVA